MFEHFAAKQVSTPMRAAYGVGAGIVAIKNMLFHFFFIYFFSNVLGVSEILIIAATWIAILFDAFSDPLMGQISDNFRSEKWGRRHKFMLIGILPTMLGLVMLFSPPEGMGQLGLFLWMLGFLLIVRLGLTIYDVPYRGLGADLSTNYDERTSVVAWREFFTNFFSIMVFVIGLLIFLPETPEFEDGMMNRAGYAPFVTTMAIIGGGFALLSTLLTKRKVPDIRRYNGDARTSWKDTLTEFKLAFRVKPFVWLCSGYCLMLILYAFGSAISFYVGGYLWRLTQIEKFLIAVLPILILIPAVLLTTFLSKRLDKKPAVILFSVVMMVAYSAPYIIYLMGAAPAVRTPNLMPFLLVFQCMGFTGLVGILILSNSMMADIADVLQTQSGRRQEGILASTFSFMQKLTFIFGSNIALVSLMIIAFPQQVQPSNVPQVTIDGLAIASLIVAIIFAVAGIYCYSKYTLSREDIAALNPTH